jgi:hypothetical protein
MWGLLIAEADRPEEWLCTTGDEQLHLKYDLYEDGTIGSDFAHYLISNGIRRPLAFDTYGEAWNFKRRRILHGRVATIKAVPELLPNDLHRLARPVRRAVPGRGT